ncbi:MAG: hypothetical protein KatS3mg090_0498 [Patescibacteria group bacterium]|nr:MAG: hypothetical protein KatS3mg090_0498 [Patescibacteria group bacterium]
MIKKLIYFIQIAIIFGLLLSKTAKAQIAGESAMTKDKAIQVEKPIIKSELFIKTQAIKAIFQKNRSSLTEFAYDFAKTCSKYEFNCYLLPSIAGVESGFGKRYIKSNNNPFGYAGGYYKFDSIPSAIEKTAETINKYGTNDIYKIGKIYAQDPNWGSKINRLIQDFHKEEQKQHLILSINVIQ